MTTIEKIRQKQAQQPTGATSLAQPEPSSAEERRQWEAFKAMGGEWVMIRSRCQDCFQLIHAPSQEDRRREENDELRPATWPVRGKGLD